MGDSATCTITVFTRHAPDCPKKDDRYWKRCKCRKALYVYENGHDSILSARTRAWEQAERLAKAEREKRDPAERELRRIKDRDAEQEAAKTAKKITVADALERWANNRKSKNPGTSRVHATFRKKVLSWAARVNIEYLNDISPEILDNWRGQWSTAAPEKYDRMSDTTQSHFQTRLKGFFEWATQIRLIDMDPSAPLRHIAPSKKRTQPLTRAQFQELMAAIGPFTSSQGGQVHSYADELRALFLLQRWVGLRIGDAVAFPRAGLVRGRLNLRTIKNGAKVDVPLPGCVIDALEALSPDRPDFRPGYFLWPKSLKESTLPTRWGQILLTMNSHLNFIDEHGHPMAFHSHMLRDTFAVELLVDGMLLEEVSRLLTHDSISTTEKYYGRWVKARRDRLEDQLVEAMVRMGATFASQ
jgi:integrase